MLVRAPATSANLGAGFDCAAVALDLWNELEVTDGDGVVVEGEGAGELPETTDNLALRAYGLLASTAGKRFHFRNRIPLERGLGSSAAAIALGLAAAAPEASAEELLALGAPLEGHADNLAAALVGGAVLTWEGRIAKVADRLPLAPIAVIPDERVSTDGARAALPREVSHADAAYTAGRAALLGAAIASGDPDLLEASFGDRLHEPYRAAGAPHFEAIRADLPPGAAGVTISGSGPTVIVWARPERLPGCAAALEERYADATVVALAVSPKGVL